MTIRASHGSRNQRAEIPLGRGSPVWVCSQQTQSRCHGPCCHKPRLLPEQHNRAFLPSTDPISQPLRCKHDRRLSRRELGTGALLEMKEFQLDPLTKPRAAKYHFCTCCDLSNPWFMSVSFTSLPPSSLPSLSPLLCLYFSQLTHGWSGKRFEGCGKPHHIL